MLTSQPLLPEGSQGAGEGVVILLRLGASCDAVLLQEIAESI